MSEPLRPHRPFDAHSLDYHQGETCVSASAVCLSLEMPSVHRRLIAVAWHDGLVSGKLIRQKGRDRRCPLACRRLASLQRASYCTAPFHAKQPGHPASAGALQSPVFRHLLEGRCLRKRPCARSSPSLSFYTRAGRHFHVLELSTPSCHIPISYPAQLPCS